MIKEILELGKELLTFLNSFIGRNKASVAISKVVEIYESMKEVVTHNNVQRFLVIKVENGGGLIKPGSDLYTSVVYEDFKEPIESVRPTYQRLLIDGEYLTMLHLLYVNQKITLHTNELVEGSLLRKLYEREGVEHSELFFLHQTKKAFFFCSIATVDKNEKFSGSEIRAAIDLAVNKIRNLMK